jgi:uridylate kinase
MSIIIKKQNEKYKRILLKLSGESLMGNQNYGIDSAMLDEYASQIAEIKEWEFKHLLLSEEVIFSED